MAEHIDIVPYKPEWVGLFDQERQCLEHCLLHLSPVVEHIGSTAVKGLGAKPVIDIMAGLRNEAQLEQVVKPLLEAGYCYYPCYGPAMPDRRLFARLQALQQAVFDTKDKVPSRQQHPATHYLHVALLDSPFWSSRIAFRDYLRSHPIARDSYYRMKVKMADQKWESTSDYKLAKAAFIRSIEWLMALEGSSSVNAGKD